MKRLEQLHQSTADVRLHEEERKQLRESLLAYIDKNPAPTPSNEQSLPVKNSQSGKKLLMFVLIAGVLITSASLSMKRNSADYSSVTPPSVVASDTVSASTTAQN
jgi:hypothetical protein